MMDFQTWVHWDEADFRHWLQHSAGGVLVLPYPLEQIASLVYDALRMDLADMPAGSCYDRALSDEVPGEVIWVLRHGEIGRIGIFALRADLTGGCKLRVVLPEKRLEYEAFLAIAASALDWLALFLANPGKVPHRADRTKVKRRGPNADTIGKLHALYDIREEAITEGRPIPRYTEALGSAGGLRPETAKNYIPERLRQGWSIREHWNYTEFSELFEDRSDDG